LSGAPTILTQTQRLYLREINEKDAHFAYELNIDADVLKYTGDQPFDSVEEARRFIENYDHYKRYGFGRWAVIRKEDEAILGWCGLKYTEELNEHDLGFRFFKKYWNNGYATEAGTVCLKLGFNNFGIRRIVGRAMKANVSSCRVLVKCGMSFHSDFDFDGSEGAVYHSMV
jgi:RimJ/RimL family protein N-acetyltransferase